MEIWVALLGLIGVVGTALISRWPALGRDGRLLDSITRDTALWEKLPPGKGRDDFAEHIAHRAKTLQERRTAERDRLQDAWAGATTAMVIAYVLLVAAAAIEGSPAWRDAIVTLLYVFGIIATLVGFILAIVAVAPPVWKVVKAWVVWIRRRVRLAWVAVRRKLGVGNSMSLPGNNDAESS